MKTLKILVITSALSILFFVGSAQTIESVENMATKYQTCLDTGVDMLGCSKRFYFQMDSMLNVVYENQITTLEASKKATLERQQIAWLKKRDNYFKKQDKKSQYKIRKSEWGKDMEMITYDEKANFIKRRVIDLIKRGNK
jgi:uncharacterized protein YecT (DUF1311 family)